MTRTKLTDAAVKSGLPPSGETRTGRAVRARVLNDAAVPGLELRITRKATKSWRVRYRPSKRKGGHGRQRDMVLGTYPDLSLAVARDEARTIIGQAKEGRDPMQERVARNRWKHEQAERAKTGTVKALAARYLDEYALGSDVGPRDKQGRLLGADGKLADIWDYSIVDGIPKKRSWGEDRRKLDVEVLPSWGERPVQEITRRDVRQLVDGIARRGAPVQANRVRALLHTMFGWALERDIVDANPATGTPRPGGSEKKRERDRVLTPDELRKFWAATENMDKPMRAFWRLRLVTAQRAVELVSMRWVDIDEDSIWTIPGSVAKNAKSHRVPLSELALEIIGGLAQHDERVLSGALGNRQRSVAAKTIHAEIDEFRGHDLRRSAASYMASARVPRLHISKVLNHSERGVTAVYDRHSYDEEKRIALATWAARLRALIDGRQGADVVPIQRRAITG